MYQIASTRHLFSPAPGVVGHNQKQLLPHAAGLFAHGVENSNSPAAKIQAHPRDHPMTLHVEEDDTHGMGEVIMARFRPTRFWVVVYLPSVFHFQT